MARDAPAGGRCCRRNFRSKIEKEQHRDAVARQQRVVVGVRDEGHPRVGELDPQRVQTTDVAGDELLELVQDENELGTVALLADLVRERDERGVRQVALAVAEGLGDDALESQVRLVGRPSVEIDDVQAFGAWAALRDADLQVPQDVALYPDLSARENLRYWGQAYGLEGDELDRRTDDVLETVGLTARADDVVEEYSGGMKRRLNFGCGIVHRPGVPAWRSWTAAR